MQTRGAAITAAWALAGALLMCAVSPYVRPGTWRPQTQEDRLGLRIYAYRQWQSTGVRLEPGDRVTIRAVGEWQYSPVVGLNGPRGGRPPGPGYPTANALGGALLGRLGDNGQPFMAGSRYASLVTEPGTLYMRINDDLLGDNEGVLVVEVNVTPAPVAAP